MAESLTSAGNMFGMSLTQPSLERFEDVQELRAFLMRDRFANAYLLGKLDPIYEPFCRWFGHRGADGQIEHLLLWYQGLSIPVAFMVGGKEPFREFFDGCDSILPDRFHFHVIEEQMSSFRDVFPVTSYQKMHRMGLERANFVSTPHDERVVRLGHRDTAAIMALYEHYPDAFFEPYQMETGLYFGVRDAEDPTRLISIAGVHVLSPDHDVAVIGNLVTHPDARGQRLATACTGSLLAALFERVSFVALNVQANNTPAIRMYTNFGFEPNNGFFEGRCND